MAGGQLAASPQQRSEHVAVDLPRPVLVGIREGRPSRRVDAQMAQLSLARSQPIGDLAQRLGASELAERHRHELSPAREAFRLALSIMLLHQLGELSARKELEYLTEYA